MCVSIEQLHMNSNPTEHNSVSHDLHINSLNYGNVNLADISVHKNILNTKENQSNLPNLYIKGKCVCCFENL